MNIYFNHLYQEAKRLHISGKVESVTDGYKYAVKVYLNSFNNPHQYAKTVDGIHQYYYTTTKFSTISLRDCINNILRCFIPEDFFDHIKEKQKAPLLKDILVNAVTQFSSDIICTELLGKIIDNHNEMGLMRYLQDKMVHALIFEREKRFQQIFNVSNKPVMRGDYKMVTRLKKEIVKLIKKNHALANKYNALKAKTLELIEYTKGQQQQLREFKEPSNRDLELNERDRYNREQNRRYNSYSRSEYAERPPPSSDLRPSITLMEPDGHRDHRSHGGMSSYPERDPASVFGGEPSNVGFERPAEYRSHSGHNPPRDNYGAAVYGNSDGRTETARAPGSVSPHEFKTKNDDAERKKYADAGRRPSVTFSPKKMIINPSEEHKKRKVYTSVENSIATMNAPLADSSPDPMTVTAGGGTTSAGGGATSTSSASDSGNPSGSSSSGNSEKINAAGTTNSGEAEKTADDLALVTLSDAEFLNADELDMS